jgi:hypothetical protein
MVDMLSITELLVRISTSLLPDTRTAASPGQTSLTHSESLASIRIARFSVGDDIAPVYLCVMSSATPRTTLSLSANASDLSLGVVLPVMESEVNVVLFVGVHRAVK